MKDPCRPYPIHPLSLTGEAWHTSRLLYIAPPLISYLLPSRYPCIFMQCIARRYKNLETSVPWTQIFTCCTAINCWSIFLAVAPASVPRNTKRHEPVLVLLVYTSSPVQSNLRRSLTNKKLIFRRQLLTTKLIPAAWPPAPLLSSLRSRSCCSGCSGCFRQRVCDSLEYRNNVSACFGLFVSLSPGPRIVIILNPSLLFFGLLQGHIYLPPATFSLLDLPASECMATTIARNFSRVVRNTGIVQANGYALGNPNINCGST